MERKEEEERKKVGELKERHGRELDLIQSKIKRQREELQQL